jgi:hypothetical protein
LVLPRLVLRVRRAVRRLRARADGVEYLSGVETQARWDAMLYEMDERRRATERRLAEAEQALNRLSLD